MTPDAFAIGTPVHVREHTVKLGKFTEIVEEFDGAIVEAYHGYAVVSDNTSMPWCIRWEYIDVLEVSNA